MKRSQLLITDCPVQANLDTSPPALIIAPSIMRSYITKIKQALPEDEVIERPNRGGIIKTFPSFLVTAVQDAVKVAKDKPRKVPTIHISKTPPEIVTKSIIVATIDKRGEPRASRRKQGDA